MCKNPTKYWGPLRGPLWGPLGGHCTATGGPLFLLAPTILFFIFKGNVKQARLFSNKASPVSNLTIGSERPAAFSQLSLAPSGLCTTSLHDLVRCRSAKSLFAEGVSRSLHETQEILGPSRKGALAKLSTTFDGMQVRRYFWMLLQIRTQNSTRG